MKQCKICEGPTSNLGDSLFLGRHVGEYEYCNTCGFTFIRDPYWLDEAYDSAITAVDLGSVYRTDIFSGLLKTLIHTFANSQASFVDYGGGYGLLVRRMRDLGYDYHWFDKHCENLFATGFDAVQPPDAQYEMLTAIEVFEHLLDPVAEMEAITKFTDHIVFTTEIIPRPPPAPGTWWYYGPEHGQHISFYTWDTLNRLARRFNLHFVTNGALHMFTKHKVNQHLFSTILKPRVSRVLNTFIGQESLLTNDFENQRRKVIESQAKLPIRNDA